MAWLWWPLSITHQGSCLKWFIRTSVGQGGHSGGHQSERGHSRWVTAACLSFPRVRGVVLSGTLGALLVSRKACGGWNPSGNPQSCSRRGRQQGPGGVSGAVDVMWDGWGCP